MKRQVEGFGESTSCTLSSVLTWSSVSIVGDRPPCKQNTCAETQHDILHQESVVCGSAGSTHPSYFPKPEPPAIDNSSHCDIRAAKHRTRICEFCKPGQHNMSHILALFPLAGQLCTQRHFIPLSPRISPCVLVKHINCHRPCVLSAQ